MKHWKSLTIAFLVLSAATLAVAEPYPSVICGISTSLLVSEDAEVRHQAMSDLIEACGGTITEAERNWLNRTWAPPHKPAASAEEWYRYRAQGRNWDWKPLNVRKEDVGSLLTLAESLLPGRRPEGLTRDELRKYQRRASQARRINREILRTLSCRILCRIPDREVLAWLLKYLPRFVVTGGFSSHVPREWNFATELYGGIYLYRLDIEGDPLGATTLNPVLYALMLSEAFTPNETLDVIAERLGRVQAKNSQSQPEYAKADERTEKALAYLLVGKSVARTFSGPVESATETLQEGLDSLRPNPAHPHHDRASVIRDLAIRLVKEKKI